MGGQGLQVKFVGWCGCRQVCLASYQYYCWVVCVDNCRILCLFHHMLYLFYHSYQSSYLEFGWPVACLCICQQPAQE